MNFRDDVSEGKGSGMPFIKLKSGESIVGVFKGDPYEFYQVWETKQIVPKGTPKSAFRFRINFVTKEGANYVAKVLEQGTTVYNQLRDLNQHYPLEETVVTISRQGSTKDDTRYVILPLPPKQQMTEVGKAMIDQVELLDLEHKAKAHAEPPDWSDVPDPDSELPF